MIVGTKPKHWLDGFFWSILKYIWEPISKKQSHWWHWIDHEYDGDQEKLLFVKGVSSAKARNNWWRNFWETNFGWKWVVVMEPLNFIGAAYHGHYQIGYISKSERRSQLCTIQIVGRCACLVGRDDTEFFAISQLGEYLKLTHCEVGIRNNIKSITLL